MDRLLRLPMGIPVPYAVGGVLAALALLQVDSIVASDSVPTWARLSREAATTLMSGFAASSIFVVGVVYLVRISAVQLNTQSLPPRLASQFFFDGVRRCFEGEDGRLLVAWDRWDFDDYASGAGPPTTRSTPRPDPSAAARGGVRSSRSPGCR